MKKLPLGIQHFREIIEDDYVYADKTQYVYSLLNDSKFYFLSRPRRFGKSLFLDTIAEAFSGDRALFKGLYLYDSDFNFEKHPVLRFDMSNIANDTPSILKESLLNKLRAIVKQEELDIDCNIPSDLFKYLIEALHKKYNKRVVVLIDEYDKPILDHIDDMEIAKANRKALRSFYGVLKSMGADLRLTFITGVSKFTKTSIFSELNNLSDITLTGRYAGICGIPVESLNEHFGEHIEYLSSLDEFANYGNLHEDILSWYDGYSWDGTSRVINPYSLLSFFNEECFSSFWYASGTPKFLLDLIKKSPMGYTGLSKLEMGTWELDTFDILQMQLEPLLFQTGYLTITGRLPDEQPPVYTLDIPNFEVRMAFNIHLLAEFTESGGTLAATAYRKIKQSLETGELKNVLATMKSLFASIPYEIHMKHEYYYHSIFYAMMNLLGFEIDAEVSVSGGRIDAVLELADKIYVMEFKYEHCEPDASPEKKRMLFDDALEKGMKQITDRGYAKKYQDSEKQIIHAAFAFLGRDDIEMLFRSQ